MRWFLSTVVMSACATTSPLADLRSIEAEVVERAGLASLEMPKSLEPSEVPEEALRLLEKPLGIEDAVRVALLSNNDARSALAQVGIARGEFVQAGLLPNPEVEFEARAPGGPQPIQVDVGFELSVSAALLAPLRAQVAEERLNASKIAATGLLLDLAYETRLAFLEVLATQQKLDLRLRAFESQQASYATALELSRAGNIPNIDLANELAAVELARVQVAEAENAMLDAREALNQRLGVSGAHTAWTTAHSLTMPHEDGNLAQAESRAISASLELLELNRLADAASKKVGLAKTEGALPHLSAGLHGERDADLWELGAHLAVGLPVFDRKQGRQLAAQSEYEGLRSKIEATAVHVRSIVRMMLNRIESAGRRARHYSERLVPARTKQLQETLLQYNAMTLGVFQVLSVQRAVTETAVAQVDATLQYLKAREAFSLIMAGRITPLRRLQAVSPSATAMDPEERGH